MGMTLTLNDLQGAFPMPKELLSDDAIISFLCEQAFTVAFPSCSWFNIGWMLSQRVNVALSVLMTAASTISAVVMTLLLTAKFAGQFVAVDAAGLFLSTVQLVSPIMPLVAVATVALLCGSAIAQNAAAILVSGWQVVLACCALHGSGFFFGYVLSRMLGLDISSSRTISIEVGMQNFAYHCGSPWLHLIMDDLGAGIFNMGFRSPIWLLCGNIESINSVLGVVLAGQHFKNPLTAVPSAVSSESGDALQLKRRDDSLAVSALHLSNCVACVHPQDLHKHSPSYAAWKNNAWHLFLAAEVGGSEMSIPSDWDWVVDVVV
ncbi:hypothetical protein ACLOJK_039331 [Asimina triloba]